MYIGKKFAPRIAYNIAQHAWRTYVYAVLKIQTSTVTSETSESIAPRTCTIELQAFSPRELKEYKHSNACINNIISCKLRKEHILV